LAKLIGVSRQSINAIESGRYVPSTVLALKMAQVFGKSVEEIFFLEDED
jgi:putative transcriptional regulator